MRGGAECKDPGLRQRHVGSAAGSWYSSSGSVLPGIEPDGAWPITTAPAASIPGLGVRIGFDEQPLPPKSPGLSHGRVPQHAADPAPDECRLDEQIHELSTLVSSPYGAEANRTVSVGCDSNRLAFKAIRRNREFGPAGREEGRIVPPVPL